MKTIIKLIVPKLGLLALAGFALVPLARAVVPAPDGGYANGNTAEGTNALFSPTLSGQYNTAVGLNALYTDTTGGRNTALGVQALRFNLTGGSNTAVGVNALYDNTASFNTAIGDGALFNNTIGAANTATGYVALYHNITASYNTASGFQVLFSNSHGNGNTGTGANALNHNTTGFNNTAIGSAALVNNTTGAYNTADGEAALASNVSGHSNTAIGAGALGFMNGYSNTAIGVGALEFMTSGNSNIGIGDDAGLNNITTGSGNVYIGARGVDGESYHTYIRNINNTSVNGLNADLVAVDLTTGLLGHASSSRRYKEDIKPIENASETLYRLKPVTYRYKKEIDRSQSPAFGLIAEEVAEASPALVARNAEGQPESVHYEMVGAMLLNEFLKEHRMVQEQQKEIDALKKELKEQKALIQQVSACIELSKASARTAANDP